MNEDSSNCRERTGRDFSQVYIYQEVATASDHIVTRVDHSSR